MRSDSIVNFRELGGMRRADGKTVKSDKLLRCGDLNELSDGDLAALKNLGLKRIVDFRDTAECKQRPDREVEGARNYSFPAMPSLKGGKFAVILMKLHFLIDSKNFFKGLYRDLGESVQAREAYRGFFAAVLEAEGGTVLWHCTQGKDRTGVAAILLLTALGFDFDACLEEYLLTNELMKSELEKFTQDMSSGKKELFKQLFFVFPSNLNAFVKSAEKAYGGLEGYLQAVGVGDKEKELLQNYYLE